MAKVTPLKTGILNVAELGEVLHTSNAGNFDVVKLPSGHIAFVFDQSRSLGPSKSGKSTLISTTSGALNLPGLPTIAVNVFRK